MNKNKKTILLKLSRIFKQPSTYSAICALLVASKFGIHIDQGFITAITDFGIVVAGAVGIWVDEAAPQ